MGYEVRIVAFTLGIEQPTVAVAAISPVSARAARSARPAAKVVVVAVVDVVGGRRLMEEGEGGSLLLQLPEVPQRPVADLKTEMRSVIIILASQ